MRKAKVFISCGQRDEREKEIGIEIDKYFKETRHFDTFLAAETHSNEALTECIFRQLEESEYFIFIDPKREEIGQGLWRGSLFVNQEIALASYLEIPSLGFSEEGVSREGIAGFQILNPIPFSNKEDILGHLEEKTREWDPASVNELWLSTGSVHKDFVIENFQGKPLSDWWHIEVHNRNKKKHALACSVYLSSIENLSTRDFWEAPSAELQWAYYPGLYSVTILANRKREVDGFFVLKETQRISFNARGTGSSSPFVQMPVLTKGKYRLEYLVTSSNFSLVRKFFILDFRETVDSISFRADEAAHLEE